MSEEKHCNCNDAPCDDCIGEFKRLNKAPKSEQNYCNKCRELQMFLDKSKDEIKELKAEHLRKHESYLIQQSRDMKEIAQLKETIYNECLPLREENARLSAELGKSIPLTDASLNRTIFHEREKELEELRKELKAYENMTNELCDVGCVEGYKKLKAENKQLKSLSEKTICTDKTFCDKLKEENESLTMRLQQSKDYYEENLDMAGQLGDALKENAALKKSYEEHCSSCEDACDGRQYTTGTCPLYSLKGGR